MSTIAARLDHETHSVRVLLTPEQFRQLEQMRQATLAQHGMAPGVRMMLRWLLELFENDPHSRWELDVR